MRRKKFAVDAAGPDLLRRGVAVGDVLFYKSGGTQVQGTIDSVSPSGFTAAFAATLNQPPDLSDPSFRIVGPRTIQSQVTSFIDGLKRRLDVRGTTPTLQELIEDIAGVIGIDIDELELRVTGTGVDRTIELAIPFDPDPIQFTEHLDLGTAVSGLTLDASADVKFAVDPKFRLPIGIRLHPDVPIGKRFFLADDDAPEITLAVSAVIDDPSITGKVAPGDDPLSLRVAAQRQRARSCPRPQGHPPLHRGDAETGQRGGLLGHRIGAPHLRVGPQAPPRQHAQDPRADGGHQPFHLRVGWRRQGMELQTPVPGRSEHAVEDEGVKVDIDVEGPIEALDDGQACRRARSRDRVGAPARGGS
jgi:hypothetical protein